MGFPKSFRLCHVHKNHDNIVLINGVPKIRQNSLQGKRQRKISGHAMLFIFLVRQVRDIEVVHRWTFLARLRVPFTVLSSIDLNTYCALWPSLKAIRNKASGGKLTCKDKFLGFYNCPHEKRFIYYTFPWPKCTLLIKLLLNVFYLKG